MLTLALVLLLAQDGLPPVPPRMPVDEELTAFACKFESALGGESCTYEARSAPGDARDNSRLAAQAGLAQCARVAAGRVALRKDCERAVAERSLAPACALTLRLTDANGNLTPDAAGCIDSLREVLWRAFFAAAYDKAFDDPMLNRTTTPPAFGPPTPPPTKALPASSERPHKT